MPTASDEARVEWNGPMEDTAMDFLQAAGYRLTRDWQWRPPHPDHQITDKERSAVCFLIYEWDFGGHYQRQVGSRADFRPGRPGQRRVQHRGDHCGAARAGWLGRPFPQAVAGTLSGTHRLMTTPLCVVRS